MTIHLASALFSILLLTGICGPGPRVGHALAYHAQYGVLVLYGGYDAAMIPQGDTWLYDGQVWRYTRSASNPPARANHAMAYDAGRGVVVLYGGVRADGELLGDTWEFDGVAWRQAAVSGPPARSETALAYDAARGVCVLYGGQAQATLPLSDTWEYDGFAWRQVITNHSPGGVVAGSGLRDHAMAYDAARGVVLLFGGDDSVNDSGNTWAYDGDDWAQQPTWASPFPRHGHAMAYDAAQQRVIVHGGWHNGPLSDAYFWAGDRWVLLDAQDTRPTGRSGHAIAYDAVSESLTLYGGLGAAGQPLTDMWALDAQGWRELAPNICIGGLYLSYVQR